MRWNNTIWHVPANTRAEQIERAFKLVFGESNVRIPAGGVAPTSVTLGGRHIVNCLLDYDLATAEEIVDRAERNWDVWGWQSFDGTVLVPVKTVVKQFLPNNDFSDLHQYQGQGAWITE